jgi:hypothetical protein
LRVEDWEQFFVAKSRRRFERERFDQRRRRIGAVIVAAILTLVIVLGIIGLAASVSAG